MSKLTVDGAPVPGSRIEVYWPLDQQFYASTVRRKKAGGKTRVVYDDGDEEMVDLNDRGEGEVEVC